MVLSCFKMYQTGVFLLKMERTLSELRKKIVYSQEYDFEYQNLIITAFLNSQAFCGQYFKYLKV